MKLYALFSYCIGACVNVPAPDGFLLFTSLADCQQVLEEDGEFRSTMKKPPYIFKSACAHIYFDDWDQVERFTKEKITDDTMSRGSKLRPYLHRK